MASDTKYNFVSEPEAGLTCVICLEVAEEPWQHGECGRLLCKTCLDKLGKSKPCPNCRKEKPLYFEDNKSKRDVRGLSVRCTNADRNCEWVGTVSTLAEHVATCKFAQVACKYKRLGCMADLNRDEVAAHEEDDKLHLHMAIDTITLLEKIVAINILKYGESMYFELPDYQNKKKNDIIFCSPSFYTSRKGYHMAVAVCANGSGRYKGTHISVSVGLLKGDYDDKLSWPFVGDVTFTLLNQLEDNKHYTLKATIPAKSNVHVDANRGFRDYISHSELGHMPHQNRQYLMNNTLYFRITVDIPLPNYRPWLECTAK